MEGLITEGEKIMAADITPEALDAAIIASAQKIEHYEISGYGTARAFARELQMPEVERLLTETLIFASQPTHASQTSQVFKNLWGLIFSIKNLTVLDADVIIY